MNKIISIVFSFLVFLAIVYISQHTKTNAPQNYSQVNPSNNATSSASPYASNYGLQTKTSGCQINDTLPDKACTPGDVIATATKEEVCQSGYSKTVRNVPVSEKDAVYSEYGLVSHITGEYEVDHYISLELGGSNDISNLWPEPANPAPGFHQKDQVENYLHSQVCSGAITLQKAQQEVVTNWLDVFNSMGK